MGKWFVVLGISGFGLWLGTAPVAPAAVSVGHSGWEWGNPRPQGNTLVAVDFAGGRGYAAGNFGTLLRTDDNGASWNGISTGLTNVLDRVRALNSDTVLIGGGCALRRSDNGGQSFTRLPWTSSDVGCPSEIASFFFASPLTGYLLADDGSIFRTADGGQTFSRRTAVPGTAAVGGSDTPTDIYFVDENTGVAVTRNLSGSDGRIFRTTDAGHSWAELDSPGAGLLALTFVGATVGFAVGDQTTLLRSDDGGMSWTQKSLNGAPTGLQLTSIDCASETTCLISEGTGARLLRTGDGGDSGTSITPSTDSIFSSVFATASRAVAVGEQGATVVSDDSGSTWSPIGGATAAHQYRPVRADTPQWAQAGGSSGTIARTTDSGVTWSLIGVPTTEFIRDMSFPTLEVGYALDSVGGAFKTVNGGMSWAVLNTGATFPPSAVLALDPENALLAGAQGIRRSDDGGTTFEPVTDRDARRASITRLDAAKTLVFAFGELSLLRSGDGGKTWSRMAFPGGIYGIVDADFTSRRVGYVLDREFKLWKTSNGGLAWYQLPSAGPIVGRRISFSSARSGFISGSTSLGPGGYALHTVNGGVTFEPQLVSESTSLSVSDTGPTGFAGTTDGSFFVTTSGGSAGTASTLALDLVRRRFQYGRLRSITVEGRLSPSEGGEGVVVSARALRGTEWRSKRATAAANGTFTANVGLPRGVRGRVAVVAQWQGDDDRAGAGSRALFVKSLPADRR